MPAPDVAIIIPVFNEADNLPLLNDEIHRVMSGTARAFEALYVDDGSTDDSVAVLERMAGIATTVRILRLDGNHGQSAALHAGIHATVAPTIVTIDADLQNDPADIPHLLSRLDGVEMVAGYRVRRHDSWWRRFSSRVANGVRDRVLRSAIRDSGCSLKAYRRKALLAIPWFQGSHRFLAPLLAMEGYRIREVPVNHRPRRHGRSKYTARNRAFKALRDLLGVRWMAQTKLRYTIKGEE